MRIRNKKSLQKGVSYQFVFKLLRFLAKFRLEKKQVFNLKQLLENQEFTQKGSALELACASDAKLRQVYLAQDSSVEDLTFVYKVYKKRHGVPIYLDIAVDLTDEELERQDDPRFDEQNMQEAIFRSKIDNILKQVKRKYSLKNQTSEIRKS